MTELTLEYQENYKHVWVSQEALNTKTHGQPSMIVLAYGNVAELRLL